MAVCQIAIGCEFTTKRGRCGHVTVFVPSVPLFCLPSRYSPFFYSDWTHSQIRSLCLEIVTYMNVPGGSLEVVEVPLDNGGFDTGVISASRLYGHFDFECVAYDVLLL